MQDGRVRPQGTNKVESCSQNLPTYCTYKYMHARTYITSHHNPPVGSSLSHALSERAVRKRHHKPAYTSQFRGVREGIEDWKT